MPVLASHQRKTLEDACIRGRRAAEQAVRAALTSLALTADRPPAHLDEAERQLRRGLRAKSRQLGDTGGKLDRLVAECAYEQWHRLLFARFLAENNLLIHPDYRAPVSIEDCEELAEALGEPDGWSVAARFAAEILPGIFRLDDPCVQLRLAPEGRLALERILAGLPAEIFLADDALGWVYQFWQKDKKDEVNASERKIGGADLAPVTQLFTENYMVRFLLENSLGAWWAAKHPESSLAKNFGFLRLTDDGSPAAGSFDHWPEHVADVTLMDPCCGSGHFLVEAFSMLWQMRAEAEGLDVSDAQDAVLRDNLFGLELDPRCVQIAMFAVAIHAWKTGGGWRRLPVPNIACSGIPVKASAEEWAALANGDERLTRALARLHALFGDADTLGSLQDPRRETELSDSDDAQMSFDSPDWRSVAPVLERALRRESVDPASSVLGMDASGLLRAAVFLTRGYTLVTTNVPYLKRPNQSEILRDWVAKNYSNGAPDLGLAFFLRCRDLAPNGSVSLVVPYAWVTSVTYEPARREILENAGVRLLALLGTGAFREITGEVVNVTLVLADSYRSGSDSFAGLDVSALTSPDEKARGLRETETTSGSQRRALAAPSARVLLLEEGSELPLLSTFAGCYQGTSTGDNVRYCRFFWEVPAIERLWRRWQSTVRQHVEFGGREQIVLWFGDTGVEAQGAAIRGRAAWGKPGIAISQMGRLFSTRYGGDLYDNNVAALIPRRSEDLAAIRAFVFSDDFHDAVRRIDQGMKVMNATLPQVPFDIHFWQRAADNAGPLPQPWSDDPTQWLFEGRPERSTSPLQVAVARLAGYRWPQIDEPDSLDGFTDIDGIVCLPSVAGEPPAVDRLQQLLSAAFGSLWSPANLTELLERTASKKKNLSGWLRDDFFKQHCALFGNRPFIWHIWDGHRDGFAALVNYHRLDRKTLEKLTYTYLGDWIERQRAEIRDETAGSEARLAAASKLRRSLELILEGEPPFDIYARWKSLGEQPIGWEPDVNDGVRVNVRPFVEAGVLRSGFNIHWRKDRGKNPDGSERVNDLHFTTAEKLAARGEQSA